MNFSIQVGEENETGGTSASTGCEEIKVAFEQRWALGFTPGREAWEALLVWEKHSNPRIEGLHDIKEQFGSYNRKLW